ncbi:MAG: fimbria/pilus outer membrane usher protein, partial [Gallionella sp.]|nr:fimbria/pilus outer membrane usher protein [Gallionella sp.]
MSGSVDVTALESSRALQLPQSSNTTGNSPIEVIRQVEGAPPVNPPDGNANPIPQETMLQIDINHQHLDETAFFLRDGDKLYASHEDLQKWRVLTDGAQSLLYQGRRYFLLSSIPGIIFQLDERTQTVILDVKPEQLALSVYKLESKRNVELLHGTGAYLNYDLTSVKLTGKTTNSGFLELGVFNRFGVGTSGVLVQDKAGRPQATRLMTTWTQDRPEDVSSLRIGDAYSQPGYWGRSVSFGGIQYASNYATQPRLIRFPYLTAAGEAVVPSTVDVFINNTRVMQQNVPPGPFSFTDLPAVTGHGEMRMVIKDVLGREQVITQPFYASDALLRVGLVDYSYDLGVVRNNYGISNNKYAHLLAAATYRKGLSESFTGELRGELSRTHQAAGVGGTLQLSELGMFVGSAALSQ